MSITKYSAEQAFKKEKYDLAIRRFGVLAEKQPDESKWQAAVEESRRHSAIVHIGAAREHVERGDLRAGVEEFDLALVAYPEHPVAVRGRAEAVALGKEVRDAYQRAKRRAQWGDCVQALEVLGPYRKFARTDPDIAVVYDAAAKRCARLYTERGEKYLKIGNYERASADLQEAAALSPHDTHIAALRSQASARQRARALTAQGRELLEEGQWDQALETFEAATAAAPGYTPAQLGVAEAKRIGTVGYLASGAAALERRDYVSALRQLKAGRKLAEGQPELVTELDQRAVAASRRLAAAYAAKSRKLRQAGLPGAALVYARLAKSLAPDLSNVSQLEADALRDARRLTRYRIGVVPLRNDYGVRGAGEELTQALVARLAAHKVEVVRSGQAHGVLSGSISSFTVTTTRPTTRSMQIEYVAGEVVETNPNLGVAMKGVGDAKMEVWTIGPKYAAAEKKQQELDADTQKKLDTANQIANTIRDENLNDLAQGRKPVYHPDHPLSPQLTAAQNAYNQAKAVGDAHRNQTLDPLKRQLDSAKFMLQTRQLVLDSTPPTVNRPVTKTHFYKEVIASTRAAARLEVWIDDELTDRPLVRIPITQTVEVSDRAVVGFAPAGLRDDPMTLPEPAEVRAQLIRKIADEAAPQLVEAARRHGQRYAELGETTGGDLGLHYRVLAILTGAGDRNALTQRIRDEHGLRWDKGTARLRSLPSP